MDDKAKDRLGDAVDEMQERGKEAMKQHGDLGGTEQLEEATDKLRDTLKSDPDEAEQALDRMRKRAVDRKREADGAFDKMPEVVGE